MADAVGIQRGHRSGGELSPHYPSRQGEGTGKEGSPPCPTLVLHFAALEAGVSVPAVAKSPVVTRVSRNPRVHAQLGRAGVRCSAADLGLVLHACAHASMHSLSFFAPGVPLALAICTVCDPLHPWRLTIQCCSVNSDCFHPCCPVLNLEFSMAVVLD